MFYQNILCLLACFHILQFVHVKLRSFCTVNVHDKMQILPFYIFYGYSHLKLQSQKTSTQNYKTFTSTSTLLTNNDMINYKCCWNYISHEVTQPKFRL